MGGLKGGGLGGGGGMGAGVLFIMAWKGGDRQFDVALET
jgi:hypothetical protein